jgi:hypothetical protein
VTRRRQQQQVRGTQTVTLQWLLPMQQQCQEQEQVLLLRL